MRVVHISHHFDGEVQDNTPTSRVSSHHCPVEVIRVVFFRDCRDRTISKRNSEFSDLITKKKLDYMNLVLNELNFRVQDSTVAALSWDLLLHSMENKGNN